MLYNGKYGIWWDEIGIENNILACYRDMIREMIPYYPENSDETKKLRYARENLFDIVIGKQKI